MKTVIHKADTRGHANHGWLNAYHTFSFANYYNPERVHFGVLRVLNDDTIAPGMGFGKHPHDNMEIITIPLEGDLEHQDSMGNKGVIQQGDIQVMSAGSGIMHSEMNANKDRAVKLLQIWIFSNKKDVKPRYEQISVGDLAKTNELYQVLSPSPDDSGVWIHQNAWFYMGELDAGIKATYSLKEKVNGVYLFIIEGEVKVADQALKTRDGMGINDADVIEIEAVQKSKVLLMEVPMK